MANQTKSQNITWHAAEVSKEEREQIAGQKGAILWLTGLSGSGKSTVARRLEQKLLEAGHRTYVLDGDNVRFGLNKDLGFSPADRTENIRRIGEVAKLFADAAMLVLTAFISPYRADRDAVREIMGNDGFIEVHVDCSLEVCEQRDPKGLYKKARAGEIPQFTGISAPYEAPLKPEVVIHTDTQTLDESCDAIMQYLHDSGYFLND